MELHQIANEVELRAFKLMWKLEGVENVDEKYESNKKVNATRAKKPTYLGVGNQFAKWKKDHNLKDDTEVENAVRAALVDP